MSEAGRALSKGRRRVCPAGVFRALPSSVTTSDSPRRSIPTSFQNRFWVASAPRRSQVKLGRWVQSNNYTVGVCDCRSIMRRSVLGTGRWLTPKIIFYNASRPCDGAKGDPRRKMAWELLNEHFGRQEKYSCQWGLSHLWRTPSRERQHGEIQIVSRSCSLFSFSCFIELHSVTFLGLNAPQ